MFRTKDLAVIAVAAACATLAAGFVLTGNDTEEVRVNTPYYITLEAPETAYDVTVYDEGKEAHRDAFISKVRDAYVPRAAETPAPTPTPTPAPLVVSIPIPNNEPVYEVPATTATATAPLTATSTYGDAHF